MPPTTSHLTPNEGEVMNDGHEKQEFYESAVLDSGGRRFVATTGFDDASIVGA
jgi:hypothetical protein